MYNFNISDWIPVEWDVEGPVIKNGHKYFDGHKFGTFGAVIFNIKIYTFGGLALNVTGPGLLLTIETEPFFAEKEAKRLVWQILSFCANGNKTAFD